MEGVGLSESVPKQETQPLTSKRPGFSQRISAVGINLIASLEKLPKRWYVPVPIDAPLFDSIRAQAS